MNSQEVKDYRLLDNLLLKMELNQGILSFKDSSIELSEIASIKLLNGNFKKKDDLDYFSAEFGSSGDMTILVIATVMVGGNSIMGGYGSSLRTSLGAIFIAMVDNMMVLQGFNSGPRIVGVGLMIVFSIIVFGLFAKGSRAQELWIT